MSMVLLACASLLYAVGGLFMKQSDGVTRLLPSLAFFGLFVAGAALQALGMRRAEMGVAYVLVLGIEAVAAVVLSIVVLNESYSASRVAAITLVLAGIVWLRST
jgi:small multidrug resistance pump/quaternary ammonium compound-resistance protein SugE